ncbi:hypothetical protein [uncultured Shewanella sp.]|uniref:hypothetical protein n=1 Tax=uncultured Shewanella sp. TaxID=173975 RepID=UPI00260D1B95|nr:hypothetical protein [uncultured Shewanella sp.]
MTVEIYKYELHDKGAFDVNPYITYQAPGSSKWIKTSHEGTIHAGQSEIVDPKGLGVPVGSTMKLIVHVNAQHDHKASEEFLYVDTSEQQANYKITGTALKAHLNYEGTS